MDMWVHILGWSALVLNVSGNLLLARMNIFGWIVGIITNLAWIGYAVQVPGGGPMWANHVMFLAISSYGFQNWKKMRSADA